MDIINARKKPVEILAVRWGGEMDGDIERWLGRSFNSWLPGAGKLEIRTLNGPVTVSPGEYIMRGAHGEFYPCNPEVFQATHEIV